MSATNVIQVAALPARQHSADGAEIDSVKGDVKVLSPTSELPELCDPEASALPETRPSLLVRSKAALSRSPIGRLFGMRVALDHTKKAAALAKEEAVLSTLSSWSSRPIDEAFTELGSSPKGIDDKTAAQKLKLNGPNEVASSRKEPWWKLLISNIVNPFNFILVILAVVAISTGDHSTFTILMIMVVLSVSLRFIQEHKSATKVSQLKSLIDNTCLVLGRDGSSTSPSKLDRSQLVVGDVIRVSTGSVVPADCIVISSDMLSVSQSSLTGEGLPVEKYASHASPSLTRTSSAAPSYHEPSAAAIGGSSATMDRSNLLFMGTHVVSGRADALVIATGDRTYVGTVACVSDESKVQNDFQRGISQISMLLLAFMIIMAPTVLVIDGFVTKDWKNAALFCLSVAVGLVPEMLPMVTTANLARGAILVARKKAIVKKLDAVQLLGAIDVLCSDKTGTLTEDHVTVASTCGPDGRPLEKPLHLAYLNAKMQTSDFINNIDHAILSHVEDNALAAPGVITAPVVDEAAAMVQAQPVSLADRLLKDKTKIADIPFDFYRRVVSIIYQEADGDKDKLHLVCKGAAEEVIRRCTHVRPTTATLAEGASDAAVEPIDIDACAARIEVIAKRGERVIAVASRRVDRTLLVNGVATPELEADMVLEGFVSILDPPKPDAKIAISQLRELGVQTKVLTGDALPTARRVCEILELVPETEGASELCITGVQLSQLGAVEFAKAVEEKVVFAKLTPIQKLEVVRALRVQGHQVAFLGDGVNDGPALRGSSCGISVNTGCDIAKDAADVILTQKSLEVIREAVVVGRVSFVNTLKYIKMAASSNFGNVFSVTVAASWLPFLPMSPTQLLTQNLLYDISQASIPWDNVDEEQIRAPVNWDTKSMLKFMVCIGPLSSPFDIFTFVLNWYYFGYRNPNNAVEVAKFQTHWFLEGALTQVAIVHVLRTAKFPFIQSRASWIVCLTTFLIAVVSMVAPYLPFLRTALQMALPDTMFYAFLFPYLIAYVLIVQVAKVIYLKFNSVWL